MSDSTPRERLDAYLHDIDDQLQPWQDEPEPPDAEHRYLLVLAHRETHYWFLSQHESLESAAQEANDESAEDAGDWTVETLYDTWSDQHYYATVGLTWVPG